MPEDKDPLLLPLQHHALGMLVIEEFCLQSTLHVKGPEQLGNVTNILWETCRLRKKKSHQLQEKAVHYLPECLQGGIRITSQGNQICLLLLFLVLS